MSKIRIAHEAPKSIFHKVEKLTDYSYALVHLFEEDQEYFELFKQAVESGREVILDNSIFELEEAFDADRFAYWIQKLKPEWYIVPDSLENSSSTIINMEKWNNTYAKSVPGKKIGVVQGKTYADIVECYDYMVNSAEVDMVALSFDYSYYEKKVPHSNKYVSWMLGRVQLLGRMLEDGIIDTSVKHHLLGSSLYWEGQFYKNSDYDWIYSMDTSNPVVFGIKGRKYGGLTFDKPSQKLFTLINEELEEDQFKKVVKNIADFRKAWRG